MATKIVKCLRKKIGSAFGDGVDDDRPFDQRSPKLEGKSSCDLRRIRRTKAQRMDGNERETWL